LGPHREEKRPDFRGLLTRKKPLKQGEPGVSRLRRWKPSLFRLAGDAWLPQSTLGGVISSNKRPMGWRHGSRSQVRLAMGVPAAARIRTAKAFVRPEEGLRDGTPALEGHVLAGPYPQLVGFGLGALKNHTGYPPQVPNFPSQPGVLQKPKTEPHDFRRRSRSSFRVPTQTTRY